MNLFQKLKVITRVVENSLPECKETRPIAEKAAQEIGLTNGDMLAAVFLFMTDVQLHEYVSQRCHHRMMQDIEELQAKKQKSAIDIIAEKYGYSERSSFERSFKRAYGVTPAQVLRGKASPDYLTPQRIEAIVKNMADESSSEGSDAGIERERGSTMREINRGINIDLNSKDNVEFISMLANSMNLYGIGLEELLLAYNLLDDKEAKSVDAVAKFLVESFPGGTVLDDFEQDCLYLALNYDINVDEAGEIIKSLCGDFALEEGAKPERADYMPVRDIRADYLWLVKMYNAEDGHFIANMPYALFIETEAKLESLIKEYGDFEFDAMLALHRYEEYYEREVYRNHV